MVKAYANGKPCWIHILSEHTARVVTPPRDEPTLLHEDIVAWSKVSGLRIVDRTLTRARPYIYRVEYAPAVAATVRLLREWAKSTADGVFIGLTSDTCELRFATEVAMPEQPGTTTTVTWRVTPLPLVPLFVSAQP